MCARPCVCVPARVSSCSLDCVCECEYCVTVLCLCCVCIVFVLCLCVVFVFVFVCAVYVCFVWPVSPPCVPPVQVISTNNDTVIKSVIAFSLDTGLFDGESLVVCPAAPAPTLVVSLKPPPFTAATLRLQVCASVCACASAFACVCVRVCACLCVFVWVCECANVLQRAFVLHAV